MKVIVYIYEADLEKLNRWLNTPAPSDSAPHVTTRGSEIFGRIQVIITYYQYIKIKDSYEARGN